MGGIPYLQETWMGGDPVHTASQMWDLISAVNLMGNSTSAGNLAEGWGDPISAGNLHGGGGGGIPYLQET